MASGHTTIRVHDFQATVVYFWLLFAGAESCWNIHGLFLNIVWFRGSTTFVKMSR